MVELLNNTVNFLSSAKANKYIVTIGPDPTSKGGIASVIAAYRDAGLFEKWPIVFLATHVEAGKLGKLLCALDALWRFSVMLASNQAGVLHIHVARRNSFWRKAVFMQLAFLTGCPVLIHLHSGGFPAFYEQECGILKKWLVRYFLKRAAALIVLTESWQSAYTRFKPKKIVVLHNFVDLALPRAETTDQPSLLFLGRLTQEKGVFDLFAAIALLIKTHPDLIVRLGGEGNINEVESVLDKLNIRANVKLEGWVDGDKKAKLFQQSSIFVLPSYVEGLPMGVLEAMSNGLAVVVSQVGGVPDMIEDGVNGLLIEPGDVSALARQLDRLLSDSELRQHLALAGRISVERRYCANAVVPNLESLYFSFGIQPYSS